MTFHETEAEITRRYHEGDYASALDLADEARIRFPERKGTSAYWRACLLARLGDNDRALAALETAGAAGHWWLPIQLRTDPDLEPLRDTERFARLLAQSERRQRETRTRPELFVAVPHLGAPHPLLLVLHGRGGNGPDTLGQWRVDGWFAAAAQSSQPAGSEAFCWDDTERAAAEAADQLAALRARPDVNEDRTVVGGFSQGGNLALRLALSLAVPYVVAAPGVHEPDALLALARDRSVPGTILVGDQDRAYPAVRNLANGLGPSCRVKVYEGLGHALPQTFAQDLADTLGG